MNMTQIFASIDWADVFRFQPEIGVTILSPEGEILHGNQAAQELFHVDCEDQLKTCQLRDFFHPDFVCEWMGWIDQVVRDKKPLRAKHIYEGKPIVSTFYPIGSEYESSMNGDGQDKGSLAKANGLPTHVLVISHHDGEENRPEIETVQSQFIDLGCLSKLSDRELEIFVLLGHGNSVPEVAKLLHRSPRTIERHKTEIGRKVGISTLADIARVVGQLGITPDHVKLERYKARI